MLAKDPARRYPTSADVADALAPLASLPAAAPPAGAAPARGRRLRRAGVMAAIVVGLLGLGVAASWLLWQGLFAGSQRVAEQPSPAEPEKPPAARPVESVPAPLPEVVTLRKGPMSREEIRNETVAWIKANDRWGAGHELVGRIADDFDGSVSRADGCEFNIGSALLKSRRATILAAHPGGLFAAELSDELARELYLTPGAERVSRWYGKTRESRPPTPRAILSRLALDNRARLDGREKVTGSLAYAIKEKSEGEYALRLMFYSSQARRVVLVYPKGLGETAEGVVNFAFPPAGTDDAVPRGLTVVFVELSSRQGNRTVIESNAVAALVRVLPGK